MNALRHDLALVGLAVLAAFLPLTSCQTKPEPYRLPTGATLDPVAPSSPLGSMPVAMLFSPDSTRIVAVLSGYRDQGLQVIDRATRRVVQTLVQPAAFLGATFSPDGRRLFVSGGDRDSVYEYAWSADSALLVGSIALGPKPGHDGGRLYPAGLACSRDGSLLYVAENLADSLAVIDLASRRVVQRVATGRYPYGVVVDRGDRVFVSAWGGSWIATFAPRAGALVPGARIAVGRHPSSLLLDETRERLYVACASSDHVVVVDPRRDAAVDRIEDPAPGAPPEGSTPTGLCLSPDGRRLYVAESDNNAVAVFALPEGTPAALSPQTPTLVGRFPVEWYPTAVLARGDSLWVLNAKGRGTGPNPRRSQPGRRTPGDSLQYTLGQTSGSLIALARPRDADLPRLSKRVASANHWDRPPVDAALPPFRHVVYVIRENRTFDQIFGDLSPKGADADSSLVYFGRAVTPNAHALAERFGIFDRFLVNAEVSADGHNWSTAAYVSDYAEKTVPSMYSGRRHPYDFEGENRDSIPADDVNEPSRGYLWDAAGRAGVSLRNYGEFTRKTADGRWIGTKPWLAAHTDSLFPGWDLGTPDTRRAERWISELHRQEAGDSMPALTILRLPNDHTAGAKAGSPTPRAFVADNDLALGRVIEALSHSRLWTSTVVIVLEDDAQDGPDHVDSHRSPLLVISAYNRPGVVHRFANTTDVIATIDRVLKLSPLSRFDRYGRSLSGLFAATPDRTAYTALIPQVPMNEVNQPETPPALLSSRLDLSREDRADEELFNRILWRMVKGPSRPYPARVVDPRVLLGLR
ncbi:MAG: bifunctional YncE family protein/alkaline phosphatase family protein [Candidatus Eisenbacteria bacterium]|uniref:Bifunctional YncE family protein/alkaline phosphatase family protein n=1 Tax=Eiseniibacteriota bacterium TaxID=2212470 RepID=A0A538UAT3_UNCEI|nr:MAG: bifunctional YncE family protein/alkaline phosphatase family protein [Candidatus Eisenbacteria bacterium]